MQKELADYFEVDPAAISRMLAALERGGFITRDAGAPRKRCGLVELTEKGRKAASDWAACCERFDERLLRGFSEAEREPSSPTTSAAPIGISEARRSERHERPQAALCLPA